MFPLGGVTCELGPLKSWTKIVSNDIDVVDDTDDIFIDDVDDI